MAKVILICGKICSGKSTYAKQLRRERNAVVLSCDELMLSLFDPLLGDKHDEIGAKAEAYLCDRALDIVGAGVDVILDWGFWQKAKRQETARFFEDRGAAQEWHYVDVSEETCRRNIEGRNAAVQAGMPGAYFVDEGLLKKVESRFEKPDRSEIDVWFVNERAAE